MAKRDDNEALLPKTSYPTQLCVAKEAGLSRTTVAEILSGKRLDRYNDETQRKVFEAAQRLNYRPHRSAQQVRRGRSNLIGVFHSTSCIQTAGERAQGLGCAIMRSGFELFLNDGLWYDGNIEHSIEQMLSARVEGVIISGPLQLSVEKGRELVAGLRSAGIPIVSISCYNDYLMENVIEVEADFVQGFSLITEHLISQGRKRLLLESIAALKAGQLRYTGFRQAIEKAGGMIHPSMKISNYLNPWKGSGIQGALVDMDPDYRTKLHDPCGCGVSYMEDLIESGFGADAIVASNDYRAFGMLTACYRRGIAVPEQIAITGSDNSYLSQQGAVPVTTLEQPIAEMCNVAVETLVHHIKGTATSKHRGAILPCRLVVRESSTPLESLQPLIKL